MNRNRIIHAFLIGILSGSTTLSCGSSDSGGDGETSGGGSGSSTDGRGAGGTGNTWTDASMADATTSGSQTNASGAISAAPIRGGGDHSAPLGTGCGPETAHECHPVGGDCSLEPEDRYELISAVRQCFFSADAMAPKATVEYVIESLNGEEYVHLRTTFDPDFVDTVYGECSADTGWSGKGHTFRDLVGSDHIELMLYDCAGTLSMHFKLDFISQSASTDCGYAALGVTGGEGKMIVGEASDVLAATSSLDRNLNGCGYCETETSPCTDSSYAASPDAPEWDFRVSYEVWIAAEAFGSAGFCRADIDAVHASPSKASENTIEVTPDECDGGGGSGSGGSSGSGGGESTTGGRDGICPPGYVNTVDLTSEDILCVPADT